MAPIICGERVRDVYLPEGVWVDFWSGEKIEEGRWLKHVEMPLKHIPVYAGAGARIGVYPHPVQCTDEIGLT